MNNIKIRVFIFGVIPMTLMQYYYWNRMIKSLTVDFDNVSRLNELYIISVVVSLIYCFYEKFIVFSMFYVDKTFHGRKLLSIMWILESVIGTIVSNRIVYHYEEKYERAFIIGFRSLESLFFGGILIASFLFCRIILYKKEEN